MCIWIVSCYSQLLEYVSAMSHESYSFLVIIYLKLSVIIAYQYEVL